MAVEVYNSYPVWPFIERIIIFAPLTATNFTKDFPPQRFETNPFMIEIATWLNDQDRQGRWGWSWSRYLGAGFYPNRLCFYFDDSHTAFEFKLRYG